MRPYPSNWLLQIASEAEKELNKRNILQHWNSSALLVYKRQLS